MNILIFEPSYIRLDGRLPLGLRPVVLHPDGTLSLDGTVVDIQSASLRAGWLSSDLLENGPIRDFALAALKSERFTWLHSDSAGFEAPLFAKVSRKGTRITNSSAAGVAISEYVMAEVLYYFQRIGERRHAQSRNQWIKLPFREIAGTTWVVIGLGAIGKEVATRARAFGARVIGVRRRAPAYLSQDEPVISLKDVKSWLPHADVVILCLPLNAETRDLVDDGFLARMRNESVLVNVGRGGLINESALLTALDRGAPSHAILDVLQVEPPEGNSAWWTHPRVSLTAHAAGLGSGFRERADALFLENVRRFLRGADLVSEIDPAEIQSSVEAV